MQLVSPPALPVAAIYTSVSCSFLVLFPAAQCLEPRLLLAGREELSPQLRQQPVGQWMWDGKSINEALADFAAAGRPRHS